MTIFHDCFGVKNEFIVGDNYHFFMPGVVLGKVFRMVSSFTVYTSCKVIFNEFSKLILE